MEITNEHLEFLDDLRESGTTNMYGAAAYLRIEFPVSRNESMEILNHWMKTFGDRRGESNEK